MDHIANPATAERLADEGDHAAVRTSEGQRELYPRHARIVELRFFGGLSVPEVASVLKVSTPTVKRDWRFARAA